jgi:hypothetical protein
MIMEQRHDGRCGMFFTLDNVIVERAGTAALEYALGYPLRRHPETDVFRRLEQRLRERRSATPTAPVSAYRPRTVRTPANEDAIIVAMEREPSRISRHIARQLGLSQPRILDVLHPYHYSRRAHVSRLSSSMDAVV